MKNLRPEDGPREFGRGEERGPVFSTRILISALPKQQKEMGCFYHSHLLSALLNALSVLP